MHQCVRHSVCCCCFQTSLKMANKELEKWNSAFTDHPLLPAGTSPGNRLPYNILPIVRRKTMSVELNISNFLWCASIPSAFIAGDHKDHVWSTVSPEENVWHFFCRSSCSCADNSDIASFWRAFEGTGAPVPPHPMCLDFPDLNFLLSMSLASQRTMSWTWSSAKYLWLRNHVSPSLYWQVNVGTCS